MDTQLGPQKIADGSNKGFYTLPRNVLTEQLSKSIAMPYEYSIYQSYRDYQLAVSENDWVYYKYSPGPGKTIKGFNRTLLPLVDGYYYVRRSTADISKVLYALENQLVPSDGNTELFNLKFDNINVPSNWKPYYLDPCDSDWCKRDAVKLQTQPRQKGDLVSMAIVSVLIAAFLVLVFAAANNATTQ